MLAIKGISFHICKTFDELFDAFNVNLISISIENFIFAQKLF
jgi:hypothetical protein